VVADVRPGSPTFGRWEAFDLTAATARSLYIPAGFAHGFQCLEDGCEVTYLMGAPYHPGSARGFRWDDPEVGIRWPLPEIAVLSPKDRALPSLGEAVPREGPEA
jgi:dTDP-4-dehydrorhamnose 3,5-epimerase